MVEFDCDCFPNRTIQYFDWLPIRCLGAGTYPSDSFWFPSICPRQYLMSCFEQLHSVIAAVRPLRPGRWSSHPHQFLPWWLLAGGWSSCLDPRGSESVRRAPSTDRATSSQRTVVSAQNSWHSPYCLQYTLECASRLYPTDSDDSKGNFADFSCPAFPVAGG